MKKKPTIPTATLRSHAQKISATFKKHHQLYPELYQRTEQNRQPVHVVYGGAQLWTSETISKMGPLALKHLETHAPSAQKFAKALGATHYPEALQQKVYDRIKLKLNTEPVEDFRIDFEDGYGLRSDTEEDEHAKSAAQATYLAKNLPPYIGIRIKSLTPELFPRAIRTFDIFVATYLELSKGKLPEGFVVTVPKVVDEMQLKVFYQILASSEKAWGLPKNSIKVEVMVETTQSVLSPKGEAVLEKWFSLGRERLRGAHFGTYDYTAACDIVAQHQVMGNPVCDFAKHVMQVSLRGSGVWLSDGATNKIPVGDNEAVVHQAWQESFRNNMHSLRTGFYQGWDLHPSQLISRYAALYFFFLDGYEITALRLKNFIEKAARATLVGEIFDDAATGQGLLNYFLRALNCRAISEEEALSTGLTLEEIRGKSFLKILKNRTKV